MATLVPPPDVRLSPSAVVKGVVSLAAGDATQDLPGLVQALATDPPDPSNPAGMPADLEETVELFAGAQAQGGLGDLWPLFAPLVSLVQSTWLASVVLLQAFASLNPLQILSALFQFPLLAFGPPLVVIIDYLTGNGLAGTGAAASLGGPTGALGVAADPLDATTVANPDLVSHFTDGLNSMAGSLGLDDVVGQLSGLIAPLSDDLGSIPATLAAGLDLDVATA